MLQNYILGGYTKRVNKGISEIQFDDESGYFNEPHLISELNGPTYVATNLQRDLLFAIHKEDNRGGIVAFKKVNNDWQELDRSFGSSGAGCYVSYREASQTIYVPNYHLGQVDVYQLTDDKLAHIQVIEYEGSSVHENQQSSHVHYADMNADQSLMYVCDLGTDIVSTYTINQDGTLEFSSELTLPAGTGPRHLVLHPTLPYAYIIGELNSTTNLAKIGDSGQLDLVETYLNIPEDKVEISAGAAIRISNDGRFLYASNRYYNVISAYSVSEIDGTLNLIDTYDSYGDVPRDFILDETELFLLIAHQESDHITVYRRDSETGRLTFENKDTVAPECVCIAHG